MLTSEDPPTLISGCACGPAPLALEASPPTMGASPLAPLPLGAVVRLAPADDAVGRRNPPKIAWGEAGYAPLADLRAWAEAEGLVRGAARGGGTRAGAAGARDGGARGGAQAFVSVKAAKRMRLLREAAGQGEGAAADEARGRPAAAEAAATQGGLPVVPPPAPALLPPLAPGSLPPRPWLDAVEEVRSFAFARGPAPRAPCVAALGPKKAGKSTLARWLVNALLNDWERVELLDLDCGQPECGPPGLITLWQLHRDAGAALTGTPDRRRGGEREEQAAGQLASGGSDAEEGGEASDEGSGEPRRNRSLRPAPSLVRVASFYVGDTSPASDPRRFAACARAAGGRRDRSAPCVVNAHGWSRGLGADVLGRALRALDVDAAVQLCAGGRGDYPPRVWWTQEKRRRPRGERGLGRSEATADAAGAGEGPTAAAPAPEPLLWLLPALGVSTEPAERATGAPARAVSASGDGASPWGDGDAWGGDASAFSGPAAADGAMGDAGRVDFDSSSSGRSFRAPRPASARGRSGSGPAPDPWGGDADVWGDPDGDDAARSPAPAAPTSAPPSSSPSRTSSHAQASPRPFPGLASQPGVRVRPPPTPTDLRALQWGVWALQVADAHERCSIEGGGGEDVVERRRRVPLGSRKATGSGGGAMGGKGVEGNAENAAGVRRDGGVPESAGSDRIGNSHVGRGSSSDEDDGSSRSTPSSPTVPFDASPPAAGPPDLPPLSSLPLRLAAAEALARARPWRVLIDDVAIRLLLGASAPPSELGRVLNGAVVGLCVSAADWGGDDDDDDGNDDNDDAADAADADAAPGGAAACVGHGPASASLDSDSEEELEAAFGGFRAARAGACPRPGELPAGRPPPSLCLGVGLVRAVDPVAHELLVLSTLSPRLLRRVRCLQVGKLELPAGLLAAHRKAAPHLAHAVLAAEGSAGAPIKSRGNVMRPGQT